MIAMRAAAIAKEAEKGGPCTCSVKSAEQGHAVEEADGETKAIARREIRSRGLLL